MGGAGARLRRENENKGKSVDKAEARSSRSDVGSGDVVLGKSRGSEEATTNPDGTVPAADSMQEAFYQVGVDAASKDPRRARERLVAAAAARVRRHPTVPADPEDPSQPWAKALAEDMAVDLPRVHCAFAGCTWRSEVVDELYEHVAKEHRDIVLPIAEMVNPLDEEERLRVEAAYHEIVGSAIRKSAPLSAYSLHRRSLKQYAKGPARKNIASPKCFMCACTFPWVRGRRGNQIEW